MQRGRGKVEFEDVRLGEGEVATREHDALLNCKTSLRRGEVLANDERSWYDLKRRDAVAGLLYGVEGMRVGGIRRIIVPPHLGYGPSGAPGFGVPPNAILICDVELLELRPSPPITPKLMLAKERKARREAEQ